MPDTPVKRMIERRKELQRSIGAAMRELGDIAKFLQMYGQYAATDDPVFGGDASEGSLGRAGQGQAQAVFVELVSMILRDVGRPLQSGEVVEEFRERGHPIGGLNEVKTAWNRLWQAKRDKALVHLPPLGYWLPDEPIPEGVKIPPPIQRTRVRNMRRNMGGRVGRKPKLTDEQIRVAEEMLVAGKPVSEIAAVLGGVSKQTIQNQFRGGRRAIMRIRAREAGTQGPPKKKSGED